MVLFGVLWMWCRSVWIYPWSLLFTSIYVCLLVDWNGRPSTAKCHSECIQKSNCPSCNFLSKSFPNFCTRRERPKWLWIRSSLRQSMWGWSWIHVSSCIIICYYMLLPLITTHSLHIQYPLSSQISSTADLICYSWDPRPPPSPLKSGKLKRFVAAATAKRWIASPSGAAMYLGNPWDFRKKNSRFFHFPWEMLAEVTKDWASGTSGISTKNSRSTWTSTAGDLEIKVIREGTKRAMKHWCTHPSVMKWSLRLLSFRYSGLSFFGMRNP